MLWGTQQFFVSITGVCSRCVCFWERSCPSQGSRLSLAGVHSSINGCGVVSRDAHPRQRPTVPPLQSLHVNNYICTNDKERLCRVGHFWRSLGRRLRFLRAGTVTWLAPTDWIFHLARSVCLSSALLACLACSCLPLRLPVSLPTSSSRSGSLPNVCLPPHRSLAF